MDTLSFLSLCPLSFSSGLLSPLCLLPFPSPRGAGGAGWEGTEERPAHTFRFAGALLTPLGWERVVIHSLPTHSVFLECLLSYLLLVPVIWVRDGGRGGVRKEDDDIPASFLRHLKAFRESKN